MIALPSALRIFSFSESFCITEVFMKAHVGAIVQYYADCLSNAINKFFLCCANIAQPFGQKSGMMVHLRFG